MSTLGEGCSFCSAEPMELAATFENCPMCGDDLPGRDVDLVRFDVDEIDWRGGAP